MPSKRAEALGVRPVAVAEAEQVLHGGVTGAGMGKREWRIGIVE